VSSTLVDLAPSFVKGAVEGSSWRQGKPGTGIPFTASSSGRARDGMTLRPSGWRTQRYETNSVLLWCHAVNQPPIGRVEIRDSRGQTLRGVAYFDQDDEFAVKVERKYRNGMMNGFSVGWDFVDDQGRSVDWRRMHPDTLRDRAFYDLTEISAVPIPSDPNALAERSRAHLRALSHEMVRMYDPVPVDMGSAGRLLRALEPAAPAVMHDAVRGAIGQYVAEKVARQIAEEERKWR
jgi:hypothetical protein